MAMNSSLLIMIFACTISVGLGWYKTEEADLIAKQSFFDDEGDDYVHMQVEFYDPEEIKVVRHNKSAKGDETIIIHDFRRGVMITYDLTTLDCYIFSFNNVDEDGSRYWKEKNKLKSSKKDLAYLIPKPPTVMYDLGERLDQCQLKVYGQKAYDMCVSVPTYWVYRQPSGDHFVGNRFKRAEAKKPRCKARDCCSCQIAKIME